MTTVFTLRKGITKEMALEIIEEIIPSYSSYDVWISAYDIELVLYEQSNLFQTTEVFEVMMNGGSYDGKDEFYDDRILQGHIKIAFDEKDGQDILYVDSYYRTFVDGEAENDWEIAVEESFELVELIAQNKNFEMVGK